MGVIVTIYINARIDAQLSWIAAPGTYVKKNEIIAQFNTIPLELLEDEQQAIIDRSDIERQFLLSELTRLEKLNSQQSVSKHELDRIRSQYKLAKAELDIAHIRLKQIQNEINRANIKSPFSGVITERFSTVGSELNKGEHLLHLINTNLLEARFPVHIKYINRIKKGDIVKVSTQKKRQYNASITHIIPHVNTASQSFEVRARIPKSVINEWTIGELAHVTYTPHQTGSNLTVHRDAVLISTHGTFVAKISNDNTVEKTSDSNRNR